MIGVIRDVLLTLTVAAIGAVIVGTPVSYALGCLEKVLP